MKTEFYNVTGLAKNPFIMRPNKPEPQTPTPGPGCLPVAWGEDVNHPVNKAVIELVAQHVYNKQTVSTVLYP